MTGKKEETERTVKIYQKGKKVKRVVGKKPKADKKPALEEGKQNVKPKGPR